MTDLTGARWRKSSRSANEGNCVEVAYLQDLVGVRDSKDPDGPALVVDIDAWRHFITMIKTDLVTTVEPDL